MGYQHPLYARESYQARRQFRYAKTALLAIKNQGTEQKIEILWIFFGIHTANAILMIDKIKNRQRETA